MNIARLKKQVLNQRPELADIYSRSGRLSLADYVKNWQVPVAVKTHQADIFISAAGKLLESLYGQKLAGNVIKQLKDDLLVSTIDHQGIFGHPFFLNSNLIFSLRPATKYLLCLPTAGVSMNNSSWPGCLLINNPQDGQMVRLSLFHDFQKTRTVLATPPFGKLDAERVISQIEPLPFLSQNQKLRLKAGLKKILLDDKILSAKSFSAQSSLASRKIWNMLFPKAPRLVYLPLEELVREILSVQILPDPRQLLHRLLFTGKGRNLINKHFLGTPGAFSAGQKGSFLFWGLKADGHRIRLVLNKNVLMGKGFSLPFDPESITFALTKRQIYPTSLVCFLLLLDCQITCLGGFNQVDWLADIRQKFTSLLKEWGEEAASERINGIPTNNFAEGSLAFGINQEGRIYKPTAIDLYLQNNPQIYSQYQKLAGQMTVAESIQAQLPEIYRVITAGPKRDNLLLGISQNDLVEHSSLEKKFGRN